MYISLFSRDFFRREFFSFLLKQYLNLSAKLFMHWSFYFMWEVTTSIYTNLEMPLNHAAFKWLLLVTPYDSSQAAWAVARHLSPSHVFGASRSAPTKEPLWKNMTNSFLVLSYRADKHWVLSDLSVGNNKEGGEKKPANLKEKNSGLVRCQNNGIERHGMVNILDLDNGLIHPTVRPSIHAGAKPSSSGTPALSTGGDSSCKVPSFLRKEQSSLYSHLRKHSWYQPF